MLILTRRPGEAIVIGDDGPNQVRVTVLDIHRDKVRIGFDAARHIKVDREEIRERKNAERLGEEPEEISG